MLYVRCPTVEMIKMVEVRVSWAGNCRDRQQLEDVGAKECQRQLGRLDEGTHSLAGLGCCPTGSLTYVGSFGVGREGW